MINRFRRTTPIDMKPKEQSMNYFKDFVSTQIGHDEVFNMSHEEAKEKIR